MRSSRAAGAGLVVLLLAGCSGPRPAAAPGQGPTPAAAGSSSPAGPSGGPTAGPTSPTGSPSAVPAPTQVRTPPPLVRPSTSSGPLRPQSLPAVAALLGPGWRPWADPGSSEDGYLGNGTPWLARDPAEVAATVLPLGCRQRTAVPTPRYALETDGRDGGGHHAVLIRARFTDAGQAAAFVQRTRADAAACARQRPDTGPAGRSAPVTQVLTVGDVVLSDRVDVYAAAADQARWSEFKLARGTDVLLLAVDQRLDAAHAWAAATVAAALGAALPATPAPPR